MHQNGAEYSVGRAENKKIIILNAVEENDGRKLSHFDCEFRRDEKITHEKSSNLFSYGQNPG